jgi:putative ABC transport system ATP-binding protein
MNANIRTHELRKTYQHGDIAVDVLHGVTLDVDSGEFLALMGPSGSGKTTLLNLIAGLDTPSSGTVDIGNTRTSDLSATQLTRWRAANVGFVFQFYHLLPALSAEKNVEIPLLPSTLSRKQRKMRVATALELVNLSDRASHSPNELSGGQQQRVAIARAIITDPPLLVCDEPTGDLDRDNATQVLTLLQALSRDRGKTVCMVTHDPIAAGFASRQLHLDKGWIGQA